MEQQSLRGGFNMNRFLPFISCAFVGVLVSSCAQNPHHVVPGPAYRSASGTPHRLAKRHHVALAHVHFATRHGERRVIDRSMSRHPLLPTRSGHPIIGAGATHHEAGTESAAPRVNSRDARATPSVKAVTN
jgi:hypothetical protein